MRMALVQDNTQALELFHILKIIYKRNPPHTRISSLIRSVLLGRDQLSQKTAPRGNMKRENSNQNTNAVKTEGRRLPLLCV